MFDEYFTRFLSLLVSKLQNAGPSWDKRGYFHQPAVCARSKWNPSCDQAESNRSRTGSVTTERDYAVECAERYQILTNLLLCEEEKEMCVYEKPIIWYVCLGCASLSCVVCGSG